MSIDMDNLKKDEEIDFNKLRKNIEIPTKKKYRNKVKVKTTNYKKDMITIEYQDFHKLLKDSIILEALAINNATWYNEKVGSYIYNLNERYNSNFQNLDDVTDSFARLYSSDPEV